MRTNLVTVLTQTNGGQLPQVRPTWERVLCRSMGAARRRPTVWYLPVARTAALQAFVADLSGRSVDDDGFTESVLNHLAGSPRESRQALARHPNMTTRQLHRQSLRCFGYGVSTLARLRRFQRPPPPGPKAKQRRRDWRGTKRWPARVRAPVPDRRTGRRHIYGRARKSIASSRWLLCVVAHCLGTRTTCALTCRTRDVGGHRTRRPSKCQRGSVELSVNIAQSETVTPFQNATCPVMFAAASFGAG